MTYSDSQVLSVKIVVEVKMLVVEVKIPVSS